MTSTIEIACPACDHTAAVEDDAIGHRATCPQCRETFIIRLLARRPTDAPDEASVHACPVCDGEALAVAAEPLGTMACAGCHGEFLPSSAMTTLVSEHLGLDPQMLAGLETFTKADPIACPGCSAALTLIKLRGVDVDWCSSCHGAWLDGGELHRLTGGQLGAVRPERGLHESASLATKMAFDALAALRTYRFFQDRERTLSTVFLGWDHANWYDVSGPRGSVAVVAEETNGLVDNLLRNFVPHHARSLVVLNRHMNTVLMELERPWYLLAPTIHVTFPSWGRKTGRVRRTVNPIIRTYELFDTSGTIFARVRGSIWHPWHFAILPPEGRQRLGTIRKKWGGLFAEAFTRGDTFSVDLGDHDWSLEQRCILLATTIAIDLGNFEGNGNG